MITKRVGDKAIRLVVGDITDMEVKAFVFDITEDCKLGSGYGGAISVRGGKKVQQALDEIGSLPTGQAAITTAGRMEAEHIIHTNGPKFFEPGTEEKLKKAIRSCLALAVEKGIEQLAFPPIGTGFYQVPLDLCAQVTVAEVTEHLQGSTTLDEVLIVALDTREYKPFKAVLRGGA